MFCLVRNRENRKRFSLTKTANTIFMHGISDPELGELYNRSKALFLPLLDAVANNALLEGLLMEKQILVSDLPAVRYYGAEQVSCLDREDTAEKAGDTLGQILGQTLSKGSNLGIRKYAETNYSWSQIATSYLEEYSNLLSKG